MSTRIVLRRNSSSALRGPYALAPSALRASPAAAQALGCYGWQILGTGDSASAVTALGQAVRAAPERAELWRAYGVALAKDAQHTAAAAALRHSLERDPNNLEAWCVLGELLLGLLDYAGAAHALGHCIALDPQGNHPSGTRARALGRQGERQLRALGQAS